LARQARERLATGSCRLDEWPFGLRFKEELDANAHLKAWEAIVHFLENASEAFEDGRMPL